MRIINDIHGEWDHYKSLIKGVDHSIQIGDFGLGFVEFPPFPKSFFYDCKGEHRFLRGNHDNPKECREHKWYLGDYGYLPTFGGVESIFFLSGAYTPNFYPKKPEINWWYDEELTYAEFQKAIDLYVEKKPRIVLTHECPTIAKDDILGYDPDYMTRSATENVLQIMFDLWQPDLWVFGHYHRDWENRYQGCRFVCRKPYGVLDI